MARDRALLGSSGLVSDHARRALDTETTGTVVDKPRTALPGLGFGVETGTDFFHDPDYVLGPWVPRHWVREVLDRVDENPCLRTPPTS